MAASFPSPFRSLCNSASRLLGRPVCKAVIIGLFVSALGLGVSFLPFGSDLEERIGLAVLFTLRGERRPQPPVVVVAVDRASAEHFNLPSDPKKWPRSYEARLVHTLHNAGARVIAFDFFFGETPPSVDDERDDQRFAQAIGEAHNVVLLGYLKRMAIPLEDRAGHAAGEMTMERMVPPDVELAQQAESVAAFPLPKVPLTVSQVWTFKSDSGDFPTMPVTVFQLYAMSVYDDLIDLLQKALKDPRIAQGMYDEHERASIIEARKLVGLKKDEIIGHQGLHPFIRSLRIVLGHHSLLSTIIVNELDNPREPHPDVTRTRLLKGLVDMYSTGSSRYLNFYGPAHTIPTIPFDQVLEPTGAAGDDETMNFKDKIVFVGSSEFSPYEQTDTYSTVFSKPNGQDLSGVEICATAVANLIEDMPVRPLTLASYALVLTLFGFTAGMIGVYLRPMLAILCGAGLVLLYVAYAFRQFAEASVWYPVVIPLVVQAPAAFVLSVLWKYKDARRVEIAHQQLKELDRLKSMFISHVSHELKTPLTSIKGFIDNMLDGLTGELHHKQRDYLARMRSNTDRLTRMISDLLDLSRIESGTYHLESTRLRLFDLADEAVAQLRPIAASKQLTMDIVCPDPTLQIIGDRDKYIQIITNLLDNAIKFTPQGGKITVAFGRKEPDRIMITVTDTGEGIPVGVISKLFRPFYQVSRRPGAHATGLGLGLSIVKTLVELHGGTISVTSEVGKGTQFCILLPSPAPADE
jgi:signal transduction histidine kinase